MKKQYTFQVKIWIYPGHAGWHFVTVPKQVSSEIKKRFGERARGWGSLPVEVAIGHTVWRTSIFPESKSGTYLLPLKKEVRSAEGGLGEGDTINIALRIVL